MRDRLQRPAGRGAESDALNHRRSITQCVHLRPGQHDADGALQRPRRQHGQHHLELRTQPGAEPPAHERGHYPHVLRLHAEHAAHIFVHVLHALGLVVYRELAVFLDGDCRGVELHRVVVLDRDIILGVVPHRGRGESLGSVAARLRRREHGALGTRGLHRDGGVALAEHVGDVRFALILHADQRRRKARDLRRLGHHQRDRLAVELDFVIVQRAERRPVRRHVVLVVLIAACHARTVLVGEHGRHAFDAHRGAGIEADNATLRDRRRDDAAVEDAAGHIELGGVFRSAGDLGDAVDAGGGRTDVGCHGCAQAIFLDDWDCGVPRAACVSARTRQRRARSILKVLCS